MLRAAELVKAVAEMRQYGEGETARRQQLENSLQEATSLFKRELAAKNSELADLHAELGCTHPHLFQLSPSIPLFSLCSPQLAHQFLAELNATLQ